MHRSSVILIFSFSFLTNLNEILQGWFEEFGFINGEFHLKLLTLTNYNIVKVEKCTV